MKCGDGCDVYAGERAEDKDKDRDEYEHEHEHEHEHASLRFVTYLGMLLRMSTWLKSRPEHNDDKVL